MMLLWWCWTIVCLGVVGWGIFRVHKFSKWSWLLIPFIVVLRYLYLPWSEQPIVGHSAQYLDVFNGQAPNMGDSTFYPSLQVVWWLIGKISVGSIPAQIWSAVAGALSIVWLCTEDKKIYWLPCLWLMILPEHLFWSNSIYNVTFPFVMLVLALRFARLEKWGWLSCAMALSVAWRLETILFWGMLLYYVPFWKWKVLTKSTAGTLVTVVLLSSMNIPGEGEYWESIGHNWWIWSYYLSYVPLVILGLFLVRKSSVGLVGWCVLWLLFHHAVFSTFNDFSSRHLLCVSIVLIHMFGRSSKEESSENTSQWMYVFVWCVAIGFNFIQLWQGDASIRSSDDDFAFYVESHDVPVLTIEQAQNRGCAWIVEMEPFSWHSTQPTRSHFNLLNPTEVQYLFEEYGCVDWCYTIQDWSWSELGIRDRAIRLEKLHQWDVHAQVHMAGASCLLKSMVPQFDEIHPEDVR